MKPGNLQPGLGIGSGALLSLLAFIDGYDIAKTVILAAIGAVVSFGVSWVLHRWRSKH